MDCSSFDRFVLVLYTGDSSRVPPTLVPCLPRRPLWRRRLSDAARCHCVPHVDLVASPLAPPVPGNGVRQRTHGQPRHPQTSSSSRSSAAFATFIPHLILHPPLVLYFASSSLFGRLRQRRAPNAPMTAPSSHASLCLLPHRPRHRRPPCSRPRPFVVLALRLRVLLRVLFAVLVRRQADGLRGLSLHPILPNPLRQSSSPSSSPHPSPHPYAVCPSSSLSSSVSASSSASSSAAAAASTHQHNK